METVLKMIQQTVRPAEEVKQGSFKADGLQ